MHHYKIVLYPEITHNQLESVHINIMVDFKWLWAMFKRQLRPCQNVFDFAKKKYVGSIEHLITNVISNFCFITINRKLTLKG